MLLPKKYINGEIMLTDLMQQNQDLKQVIDDLE